MAREPTGGPDRCAAVVLAGGYSTRFGDQDKAIAELDGKPLVRHVVERVTPAVGEVVISCREEQRNVIERALSGTHFRVVTDPIGDRGPVAGIRAGCRTATSTWTFVTACDMPFIDPRPVYRLCDAADARGPFEVAESEPREAAKASDRAGETDAFVPQIDGRPRPLAAVYRTTAVCEAADATLEQGSGATVELLDRLSTVRIPELVSARAVADIDTRAELRAAQSRSS